MIAFADTKGVRSLCNKEVFRYIYNQGGAPLGLSHTKKEEKKKKIVANAQGKINGETSRGDSNKVYIYQASIETTKASCLYIY
jgi:hypothetical protein